LIEVKYMLRFLFLLLLLANAAMGVFLYLQMRKTVSPPPVEVNPSGLKLVSVLDPQKAQVEQLAARKLAESLVGSACIDFSVKPADAQRAQGVFAQLALGERLSSKNIEEPTRFALVIAPATNRKAADTALANLKKLGLKDISITPDNGISLGLYSTEDAAKKVQADAASKGARAVQIQPRNLAVKETIFSLRDPDTNLVAKLTLLQRDYEASSLKAVACNVSPQAVATVAAPTK
jgi:hypothetical protein